MGFTLFNRLARSLGYPVDDDPDPDGDIILTFEEFSSAVDKLALSTGSRWSAAPKRPGRTFKGWRINYESVGLPPRRRLHGAARAVVGHASQPARRRRRTEASAAPRAGDRRSKFADARPDGREPTANAPDPNVQAHAQEAQ